MGPAARKAAIAPRAVHEQRRRTVETKITRVLAHKETEPAIYLVRVRRADTSEETLRMNRFILQELLCRLKQPLLPS